MIDLVTAVLILILTIGIYFYVNKNKNYWKDRNVPYIPPLPIFGNLKSLILLKKSPGQFLGDLYNSPEAAGQKFLGMFIFNSEPALLIRDTELIKNILVRDFQHFSNRYVDCDEKCDPVGVNNLFVLRGPKWKYLRSKLTPTFTSGKMKQMFLLIKETADDLIDFIEKRLDNTEGNPSAVLESRSVLGRFTMDVISTCAFGIKSNTLKDDNSSFRFFGTKIFYMTIKRSLEVRAFFFMHWMAKTFKFVFLQKESTEFFRNVFWQTINEREKSNVVRNDFIDILINLKKNQKQKLLDKTQAGDEIFEFEGDMLLAQPVLFFIAGFETTSATISLTLYELALQPDIQEKLRLEIISNLESHGGELTYEGVFEMKYLDMVVSETLRKYPPMPFIDRLCTMDYKIPDTDVVVKKGTPAFIPLYNGLHYDPNYYPDPNKYDPERFSEENKATRPAFAYIPFGEGPHVCIGMRFGLMNVKTALSLILTKYRVEKCEKTQVPLEMDNRSIIMTAKQGTYIKFIKL